MTNHYPNEQDAEEMARRYGRGNERDELRARIKELEAERGKYICPIGLDDGREKLCSAGTCLKCRADLHAAEVEALRKENERLKWALVPLSENAEDRAAGSQEWRDSDTVSIVVTIGDLRRARAALQGETG